MKPSELLTPLYFMDWFGRMLEFDATHDALTRKKLIPFKAPDLFVDCMCPLLLPCPGILRTENTTIKTNPIVELEAAGAHYVALRDPRRATYLSINPTNSLVHWDAPNAQAWESFVPLTRAMFLGLSYFADRNSCALTDENGVIESPLEFGDTRRNQGGIGKIGDFEFDLGMHLPLFAQLARLKTKGTLSVRLLEHHAYAVKSFTLTLK